MAEKEVRLGIVVSEMHWEICGAMLGFARQHAEFLGARIVQEISVPGVFDMPLAVKKLLEREDVDAVATLGAVIEGETEHDRVIMNQVARKLIDLSLQYNKPVSLGISGPAMTRLQGLERVNEYARRAVESAVKLARKLC
jgi:6,7-dimethyl-8-ribityllumazine synthase